MKHTYTKKGCVSCGVWDPTLHYLNRNHVFLLSPLNCVFKIPSEETEDDPCHMELASCGLGWRDHKSNSELAFPWLLVLLAGLWWWQQVPSVCTFRFALQCYWLISQFTKKKKIINYAQSKLCESGRCWMKLLVPTWSDLCFRLCKLHSLEQLTSFTWMYLTKV